MRTILIAVDAPEGAVAAARHVAQRAQGERTAIHLLKVQPPIRSYAGRFLGAGAVRDYHRDAGRRALAPARQALEDAGLDVTAHVHVGDEAGTIADMARRLGADEIVMGEGGAGWLGRLMFHHMAARVIRRAGAPVLIVKGRQRAAGLPFPRAMPLSRGALQG